MGNSLYFRFDDDNKIKYIYPLNHKAMGKPKTRSPTYFVMDNWENMPYHIEIRLNLSYGLVLFASYIEL